MIIVEEVEDGVNKLLSNVSGRRHSLAMVGQKRVVRHTACASLMGGCHLGSRHIWIVIRISVLLDPRYQPGIGRGLIRST
jgi:hypothetical protein